MSCQVLTLDLSYLAHVIREMPSATTNANHSQSCSIPPEEPHTPPPSPTLAGPQLDLLTSVLKQILVHLNKDGSNEKSKKPVVAAVAPESSSTDKPQLRALRLKYKSVVEVYVTPSD